MLFFLLIGTHSNGQGLNGNNWYFGNSEQGIRFNKSDKQPFLSNNQATPFGTGGSAVATDPVTGDLLFYTDGQRVYDASHRLMPGGDNLGGNTTANQPVSICPIPETVRQYYIFSNNPAPGSRVIVSIVDMTLTGNAAANQLPLGEVTSSNPTSIISETEGMTVIQGKEDKNWLVSQNAGIITFTEVTATLPFSPVNSITDPQTEAVNFAFNQEKNLLAIVPGNPNANIKIYEFNPEDGGITIIDTVQNSARAGELLFDAAWSPDGEKLFFSRSSSGTGITGQVYQYYADTVAPQPVLPTPVYRSYGIQTGPDGRLYHLYQEENSSSPYRLGRLENPDSIANYNYTAWQQTVNFNGTQFPQFSPQEDFEFENISFEAFDLCANGRTKFIPDVRPAYDSLVWNIADTTINAISPELTFDAGGNIEVTLTAYLNGIDSTILAQTISIIDNPYEISLPSNDTTVCASAFPGFTLEATVQSSDGSQAPPMEIYWSNNPSMNNATGTFDSTGTYYVVAVTPSGCTISSSVDIKICQEEKRVGNIWFFGDRAGIDFNPEEPTPIPDSSVMNAPAGTSTISDRNGRVIFYTDGNTVWNRNNEIMPNGTDIGGDPQASQSSLIVPFPGDPTRYYIFTTGVVNGGESEVRYSIVDTKVNNTLGDVEAMTKGTSLFPNSTEKITAVEAGDTTWLLIHEVNNDVFRAFPISSGGIGTSQPSEIGSQHSSGKGYMKFSSDGSRVAAAVPGSPGFVEVFNFDDSSGFVTDPIKFEFPGEEPYGVEFSPDNEKLYVSTASALYQFHVNDTLTTAEVIASKKTLDASGSNFGALQLGPNGQIYMAVDGSTDLLVINGPNTLETDTSHVSINTFSLLSPDKPGTVTSGKGLPNFVQSIMEPLSEGGFDFEGQCLGDETQFTASERCDTDLFAWQILDASNRVIFSKSESDDPEAAFQFPAAGLYSVSLMITNPCHPQPADTTITKEVEIFAPPADPEFPATIALCEGDTLLTAGPDTEEFEYYWSTGDTTNAIRIDRRGNFSVTILNTVTGCNETYATSVEYAVPEVDLGPDLIVCEGETPNPLDAGSGGSSFVWTVNGSQAGTTRRQAVATDVAGEFLYKVVKTGPLGCEITDSVIVVINGRPEFAATPAGTSNCGSGDGSISLANNGVGGNFSFLWSSGETTQDITGLSAGLYNVTITDETTGCEQTINNIRVDNNNSDFQITGSTATPANCGAQDGSITVTINNPLSFPIDYTLYDEDGNIYGLPTNPVSGGDPNAFTITGLEAGIYSIQITSDAGCVQNAALDEVTEPEKVAFDVDDFVEDCGDQATIRATSTNPSVSFNWTTVDGAFTGVTNAPVVGVSLSGTYTVTASFPGQCDSIRTVVVQLDPGPTPGITISGDDCNGQYILTAIDDNNSNSYRWTRGGTVVGYTRWITATQSGNYTLEVLRPGCSAEASIDVQILEEPLVNIEVATACSEDEPFTLFANASPASVKYTWFYPNGNVIPGQSADSVRVRDEGTYRVRVENGTCSAEAEVTVTRNAVGASTLPEGEVIICPSSSDPRRSEVFLNPDSANVFIKYRWEVDEQFISNEQIIKPSIPGEYRVIMTNLHGCIVEDEVRVVLVCKPVVFVPNAIRPGSGIGQNKTFRIFTEDGISPDEFQVYIFNRWGEMIYQSKDKDFQWDGTFKGQPVPVATYSYVIRYKGAEDPSNEIHEIKGGVTVLR